LIRNLREHWRRGIIPVVMELKQDTDGVWLTRNNRRVFVTAATENPDDESWSFSVKPKSYEILVLLCWGKDFLMHDFVIPQKLYVAPWTAAKKAAGKEAIVFSIRREGGKYLLCLPHADGIDITDTEASYGIIGN